jgi:DNA-binding transcriptional LysR family regulator
MRGTADVGLSESKPGHTEFRYHGVFRDRLTLCASHRWRADNKDEPSWKTLGDFAPIVWERETDLEPFLLQELDNRGHNPSKLSEKRLRLHSTAAVISMMQSGRYAAFVSFGAVRHLLSANQLACLDGVEISVPYWIFAPRHREIEPLAALVARGAAQLNSE